MKMINAGSIRSTQRGAHLALFLMTAGMQTAAVAQESNGGLQQKDGRAPYATNDLWHSACSGGGAHH